SVCQRHFERKSRNWVVVIGTGNPFGSRVLGLVKLAERGGFEPPVGFKPTHAFQACALNHSAISPLVSTLNKLFNLCNIFPCASLFTELSVACGNFQCECSAKDVTSE